MVDRQINHAKKKVMKDLKNIRKTVTKFIRVILKERRRQEMEDEFKNVILETITEHSNLN